MRQETRDRRQETGDKRQETRHNDKRQETRDRRQEKGDKKREPETGDKRIGMLRSTAYNYDTFTITSIQNVLIYITTVLKQSKIREIKAKASDISKICEIKNNSIQNI